MQILTVLFSAALTFGSLFAACTGNAVSQVEKAEVITGFTGLGHQAITDTLPELAKPLGAGFRDLNTFISGDHFCIVSVVDNISDDWEQLWIQAKVLDANGKVLKVKGDTTILLKTLADAVPPRGATALFCAIPLSDLSGTPASCQLEGAGSVKKSPGPILVVTQVNGVRAMYPDPDDPNKVVEKVFNLQATIENPLDMTAQHYRMTLLLYGKDQKLYFAQSVGPEDPETSMKESKQGPLGPQENRQVMYVILYEHLPQQLKDTLIGRVDIQVHEAR